MSILRGLFRDPSSRGPDAGGVPVGREVGHRVFVEQPPDVVWPHLVSPAEGTELGVDCVRVLALPRSDPGSLAEFATVWRRSNGRLFAGLATVVALEHGERVVVRAADGGQVLDLVTTLEPLDHGCVVAQRLDGVAPADAVADFARGWMARALLGLKADIEGTARPRPAESDAEELVDPSLPAYGHELGHPSSSPVTQSASVTIALPPEQLWAVLATPTSRQLGKPSVERIVRIDLADEREDHHLLAIHRRDDGRRALSVSRIVDYRPPSRIVERDLTSPHESDVETTIEPAADGSVLTESLTTWLPAGPGHVAASAGLAARMRARLEVLKQVVEHDVRPQRDPRTGFLPPGQGLESATTQSMGTPGPTQPSGATPTGLPSRPSVPSSVLMPPPHVAAPASGYVTSEWPIWGDVAFYVAHEVDWW